jgi:ABC-type multidrug transport system fused ATPase/permease subunit
VRLALPLCSRRSFTSLICVFGTIFRQRRVMQESRKLAAEHRDDDISSDHSVFGANFKFDIQPTTIEFENVGCVWSRRLLSNAATTITVGLVRALSTRRLTLKNAPKGTPPILSGVTGRIPPASLTALMGPSGCGKTTFMNAILGRTSYGVRCGTIKVNGVPDALVRSRGLVGFVPQDDIVHGSMTVYQNLYYHAELRLPRSTTKEMKMEHVQHVINVLGLSKVQDAVVGTPERRGVSGGRAP